MKAAKGNSFAAGNKSEKKWQNKHKSKTIAWVQTFIYTARKHPNRR